MTNTLAQSLTLPCGAELPNRLEQAGIDLIEISGGADLIGLGRPMWVDTDAPARLLAGEAELSRYENQLSLFPSWLSFLQRVGTIRAIATFAVQYWFYEQLDSLGRNGAATPGISVFAAARRVMAAQQRWLKGR